MTRHKLMPICFLLFFLCSPAAAEERDDGIRVSGTGVVSVKPDRARIRMQVSQVEKSIVSAKKAVDEKVRQVQKMLLDQGVKPSDINASGLSVYEERIEPVPRDGGRDVGPSRYRVSREITAKIEDVSKLDVVLDNAVRLGTNAVQNIEFYSSRIDEIRYEALRKASEDAARKAGFLAGQFGCKLGKPRQIAYDSQDRGPQPYLLASAREASSSFLQGTVDVTATISVVYGIE